jgi:hypothetical protein
MLVLFLVKHIDPANTIVTASYIYNGREFSASVK